MNTCNYLNLRTASVAELVRAAQAGDRAAFGELYERFARHVFAVALSRLGDYNDAQELCQDAFVQALLKLGQLRTTACFAGWLRMITRRLAINRVTRGAREQPTDWDELEASSVEHETPLAAAIAGERRARVQDGLNRLRDLDGATLIAFYVDGQSLAEMSDEFQAPLGTIKRRLHVARKRLAKKVAPLVAV